MTTDDLTTAPRRPTMPPVRMSALRLGDCCCPVETILPGVDDGRQTHLPVASYLLTLGDGSLVLVDTGMSRIHVEDPDATWRGTPLEGGLLAAMRLEDTLVHRLGELGADPRDIAYVVNTHLHFDHAGNNDLLAGATFFVQRTEYEYAKGNPSFPNQYWNLPGLRYELVDGEAEPLPGILLIPTAGHTPGHQSVLVTLPESGPVILCGDAVYCEDNYRHDNWEAQADPGRARASALRLRTLAEEHGAQMLYGHDRDQSLTMAWAPRGHYA